MMRRALVSAAILMILALTAGPATAQNLRDPFDPLLTTGSSTTAPGENGEAGVDPEPFTPSDEGPSTEPPPATDDLPHTGAAATEWLALAYVLLVAGAGLWALSRQSHRKTI